MLNIDWVDFELFERDIKISILKMGGYNMKDLIGFFEGLFVDLIFNFSNKFWGEVWF